jgi:hypothetical protein
VTAGVEPQDRDVLAGDRFPVRVQLAGGLVKEGEPQHVPIAWRQRFEVRNERAGEAVRREDVHPAAEHERRGRVVQGVEDAPDGG